MTIDQLSPADMAQLTAADQVQAQEFAVFLERVEGKHTRNALFDADLATLCPNLSPRSHIRIVNGEMVA